MTAHRTLPKGLLSLALGLWGCQAAADRDDPAIELRYVGRDRCVACHRSESGSYEGSHHDHALAIASDESVLADFDGTSFTHGGVTSRFDRRDGRFFVTTRGADGTDQELEIRYAVGIEPLQQYLVELPGGRLQRLALSWDVRPERDGGGRWFHVYGDEGIAPDDLLHWSKASQTWNLMCAECHSTDVSKNYDPGAREYRTSWSEIDVSCEACHGPASGHLAWAAESESAESGSTASPTKGLVAGGVPSSEVCARCHSHRTRIGEYRPGDRFLDAYDLSLLRDPLYYPDGQVREEVFVYGSFLQSQMYVQGVGCIDCHDPHTARLHVDGNALCTRCHDGRRYDGPGHHAHAPESSAAQCVECHMPTTTFMRVDGRRDHSFATPRPGIVDSPNPCLTCHTTRSVRWVSERIDEWFGPPSQQEVRLDRARAFRAAEIGDPAARDPLVRIAADHGRPAIVRATALSFLSRYPGDASLRALEQGAADPEPLVRSAAARALRFLRPNARAEVLLPLLEDSVRLVRISAARALAGATAERLSSRAAAVLENAWIEYERAKQLNVDDPATNVELGDYYMERRLPEKAEFAYRRAIQIEPGFVPAYVNLADLYRAEGRDREGHDVLLDGLARAPQAASLRFALGLLHVRDGDLGRGLEQLRRAAEIEPNSPRIALAYALALQSAGRPSDAAGVLQEALRHGPFDRDLLLALVGVHREMGEPSSALGFAERLAEAYPEDERLRALERQIRGELSMGGG